MKKYVFSGFMASMLVATSAAFAEGESTTLTTKNYVDSGLRAVYNVASSASQTATAASTAATAASNAATAATNAVSDMSGRVGALESTVGDATDGLVKDVADLQSAVGDANGGLVQRVNELEAGSTYTGGVGISVDANNQIGLSGLTGATDGKTYVFKDGAWVELPIADTWDDSILTPAP